MLVKLLHDVNPNVSLPGLPNSGAAIEPQQFSHSGRDGTFAKFLQFPVTLAYAITDFKCQGLTFERVIVDLKKPAIGFSSVSSPYVQISRATTLSQLSIMRPFDPWELQTPAPPLLTAELHTSASEMFVEF